ncbi:Hcy-binding domain-containing protein [Mycena sanguinolenta]|uniref:Hcy-binding domain-containing protein n=1 Tax=Mycena sanguinolenta TaxID=230812 RepID=A0A8H6ZFY7_9AGAR|nr:Hcy-binding domain-containing protein [Mycena sanguinolenta]
MSDHLPLYRHNTRPTVKVLDGGLGTTLENSLDISHTPLWSAKAAIEHPDHVIDAHLAFLRSGAQIILTSTYQCSLSSFHDAGYTSQDALEIMPKCVHLAAEAKARFRAETRSADGAAPGDPSVKIALSLGPFGAGLSPAQEFDGYYPPPFGPRGYTPGDGNYNAFSKDDEGLKKEAEATAALALFHFERLCAFADDEAAWNALDFIAFETVPLIREIRAIRMAMAALEKKSIKLKPWWISCVFPEGRFPESLTSDGDAKVPIRSVVAAAIQQDHASLASSNSLPVPSALGINCTEMSVIPTILADMEAVVLAEFPAAEGRPWLVLYPNGGDVYDPVSQTWAVKDKNNGGVWAQELAALAAKIQSDPEGSGCIWSGVVGGGLLPDRSRRY